MWKVLFYIKADQGRRETYYSTDQAFKPILAMRPFLGAMLRDVCTQYKRLVDFHAERKERSGARPWVRIPGLTYWTGTRRFVLSRDADAQAISRSAAIDVKDMASSAAIADFLAWSLDPHDPPGPACLVLWSHGSGWKSPFLYLTKNVPGLEKLLDAQVVSAVQPPVAPDDGDAASPIHGLPEFAEGLRSGLARAGRARLDVIAFHSCFMSCIEAAYEIRDCASVLVGSEEETPFVAWQHHAWMANLASRTSLPSPEDLATMIVESYPVHELPDTTLSAIRLGRGVAALTEHIREFVTLCRSATPAEWDAMREVRGRTGQYGWFDGPIDVLTVDIPYYFDLLQKQLPGTPIGNAAGSIARECSALVVSAKAGAARREGYGSRGLSIFFPKSRDDFKRLDYRDRYEPDSPYAPTFVAASGWREFLEAFWG